MTNIRLLPVVVLAIAALLMLKTLGLVTNGEYVLTGASAAIASGGEGGAEGAGGEGEALTLPSEPTIEDISPTLADTAPTLGAADEAGHGASAPAEHGVAEGETAVAEGDHGAEAAEPEQGAEATGESAETEASHSPETPSASAISQTFCRESDASINEDGSVIVNPAAAVDEGHGEPGAASEGHGEAEGSPLVAEPHPSFAASLTDCLPSGDAIPLQIGGTDGATPLLNNDGSSPSEQQLLERLAARRAELQQYEQDLAMRASIVDAAEKRIEERATTLAALEAQISSLVDQRQEMESGQFAGIVAMYEAMKPKDAANIFNALDIEVLLRVAQTMSPRKMAPILAEMDAGRAQELTVRMASLADRPATEMTAEDLAALPQIVGQ